MLAWHRNLLDTLCTRLCISYYAACWIAFFKGVIVGGLLFWLVFGYLESDKLPLKKWLFWQNSNITMAGNRVTYRDCLAR